MIAVFKSISFLWPFISEMILGKKTFKESLSTNKKRVFFLLLVFGSLGMNVFLFPKVIAISKDYIDLDKKNRIATDTIIDLNKLIEVNKKKCNIVLLPVPDNPITVTTEVKKVTTKIKSIQHNENGSNRYDNLLKNLNNIKQNEKSN